MSDLGWYITGAVVLGVAAGAFIVSRTQWFQLRLYGARVARIVKQHDLQKKSQALQKLPDPTKASKQLRELAAAYDALIKDLEKLKVPAAAQELHNDTLTLNRKAAELYRIVATGKYSPKDVQRRQTELQKLERSLQQRVQALYGKKPQSA